MVSRHYNRSFPCVGKELETENKDNRNLVGKSENLQINLAFKVASTLIRSDY